MDAVWARGLRKDFRRAIRGTRFAGHLRTFVSTAHEETVAVGDVTFMIPQGQIVGCLGPNGAGKSTTIKMLTGILWPTAGEVRILGYNGPSKVDRQSGGP